jgi:hypothetical protein
MVVLLFWVVPAFLPDVGTTDERTRVLENGYCLAFTPFWFFSSLEALIDRRTEEL